MERKRLRSVFVYKLFVVVSEQVDCKTEELMSKKTKKPFLGRKHHDFQLLARRTPCLRVGDILIVRICFLVDGGNYDERRGYVEIVKQLYSDDSGHQVSLDLHMNKKTRIAKLHGITRDSSGYLCVQGLLTVAGRSGYWYSNLLLLDESHTKWIPSSTRVRRSGHRKKCRKILEKWNPDTVPAFVSLDV